MPMAAMYQRSRVSVHHLQHQCHCQGYARSVFAQSLISNEPHDLGSAVQKHEAERQKKDAKLSSRGEHWNLPSSDDDEASDDESDIAPQTPGRNAAPLVCPQGPDKCVPELSECVTSATGAVRHAPVCSVYQCQSACSDLAHISMLLRSKTCL